MIDLDRAAVKASSLGTPARRGGFRHIWRRSRRFIGIGPFLAYLILFLVIPSVSVVTAAFQDPKGHFTWSNINATLHGVYFHAYGQSLELAAISALVAAIAGTLIAIALVSTSSPILTRIVTTGSGVFANTGGLPLAFAFIASLGTFGIVTKVLNSMGFNPYDHGFTLYSLTGLVIVYCYFLVPLMVLVMLPAVEHLKREWFDAAEVLGASRGECWRHVGFPLLAPAFVAALMVLFTDAFAAYATAEALTQGTIPLVPLEIGSLIQGNVLSGQQNVGDALGLGMVVIVIVAAVLYGTVQRKAARWQQ